jgi:hypothetical protein
MKNESICQIVFISAQLEGEEGKDIKFNLWSADYCAAHDHWLSIFLGGKMNDTKLDESLRKLTTTKKHTYQGEATFSPDGAKLAFVQGMPAESKYNIYRYR